MRIISGSLKGRVLKAPENLPVRPTTDRAKEGLFNMLVNRVDFSELTILDLFSGIGSVSIEFLSRGAKHVTSVDDNRGCVQFQTKCEKDFNLNGWNIVGSDALRFLERTSKKFDLIFADPPYHHTSHEELHTLIRERELLAPKGLFILEHEGDLRTEKWEGFEQVRKYGRVHFSFFNNTKATNS